MKPGEILSNSTRDRILGADVAESIQGHVGPNTKQVFETLTAVPFSQPRLKLSGYEFVMRDQFSNYYHKMRAVLFDGELYDIDQHIKPSMMMKHGGGHADYEDRAAKARLRITEGLLKEMRENGALALGRANMDILKGKQMTTSPIALETQDITHQSNVLEDALTKEDRLADAVKAAKLKAGETVHDGPVVPDGFVPLKAEKAPAGEKLGEVIAFPALTPKPKESKALGHEQPPSV